ERGGGGRPRAPPGRGPWGFIKRKPGSWRFVRPGWGGGGGPPSVPRRWHARQRRHIPLALVRQWAPVGRFSPEGAGEAGILSTRSTSLDSQLCLFVPFWDIPGETEANMRSIVSSAVLAGAVCVGLFAFPAVSRAQGL